MLGRTAVEVLCVTLGLAGSVHAYRSSMLVNWSNRNTPALALDIDSILDKYG